MKRLIKRVVLFVFTFAALPLYLLHRLQSLALGRERSFYDISQFLSLFPGVLGNYLRSGFYTLALKRLGEDACICFGATLSHPDIEIGRGVYVGPYCNLGLCSIDDDALLGTGVHVMSGFGQHGHADLEKPIREQGGSLIKVRIGADTWIGNKSLVGNHVGRKCIIGSASLVFSEIPDFAIAVGNPAEVIKDRRDDAPAKRTGTT